MQSAALFAAIAVHWNANAAVLLVPPYLGFQVLAYFAAEGMWRLADAKALRLENERLAERVRISRELHDRLGHHLTALRLNLEVADRRPDALAAARELGRGLLDEVRAAVEELRDPERLDLGRALRTLAEELVSPRVHVTAPEALAARDPALRARGVALRAGDRHQRRPPRPGAEPLDRPGGALRRGGAAGAR